MDIRKAINVFKGFKFTPREMEAVNMATEALEKQIPMPVKVTTSTKRCGRCNRQLSGIGNSHPERSYCPGCGQAIKWED